MEQNIRHVCFLGIPRIFCSTFCHVIRYILFILFLLLSAVFLAFIILLHIIKLFHEEDATSNNPQYCILVQCHFFLHVLLGTLPAEKGNILYPHSQTHTHDHTHRSHYLWKTRYQSATVKFETINLPHQQILLHYYCLNVNLLKTEL